MNTIQKRRSQSQEVVVAYTRVSTSGQEASGYGLISQRKAIMNFCKGHRFLVHEVYEDVISGTESSLGDRTAYWDMLKYAKDNSIAKVIVYDVNRLFRDPASCVLVKKAFKAQSLDVLSVNQPTYSIHSDEDPSEFLINSLLESLSHYDRLVILSKLKAGRDAKAANGEFAQGSPAFGLQVINRQLAIEESEFKVLTLIFALKRKKFTAYRIAKFLNNKGIKSRKRCLWYPNTIRRILRNPIYSGYFKYEGKLIKSALGKLI